VITENLLDSTFGHAAVNWETAKEEAREILAHTAEAESTITYGDLARRIRSVRFDPHGDDFRHFLGQLSWEADLAGRGMITVLVVHAGGDNRPGKGFFALAKHLRRDVSDPDRCWVEELERVYRDFAKMKVN
jgi:hypothetical protein